MSEVLPVSFIENEFQAKLINRSNGRSVQIISDFDETLASNYIFSEELKTHLPVIRTDLSQAAQKLIRPIAIATARSAMDPAAVMAWQQLSGKHIPLVAENGAVLIWPGLEGQPTEKTTILATPQQQLLIQEVQALILADNFKDLNLDPTHQVRIHPSRLATVSLRAQEILTKVGTGQDYPVIEKYLSELLASYWPDIEVVSSGSSLGIQPRGIDKKLGIGKALESTQTKPDDVFLVGLGDNKNDRQLFEFVKEHGGLNIGVKLGAGDLVDYLFDGGDEVSYQTLKVINSL